MRPCPICGETWQIIQESDNKVLFGHYCEVAERYVFWNWTEVFLIPDEKIYQNPPERGNGE